MAYAKLPDSRYIKVPDNWTKSQIDEAVYRDFPDLFPDQQPKELTAGDLAGQAVDVAGDFAKRIPGAAADAGVDLVSDLAGSLYGKDRTPEPVTEVSAQGDAYLPGLDLMRLAPLSVEQRTGLTEEQARVYEDKRLAAEQDWRKTAQVSGATPTDAEVAMSGLTSIPASAESSIRGLVRSFSDTAALGKRDASYKDILTRGGSSLEMSPEQLNAFQYDQQKAVDTRKQESRPPFYEALPIDSAAKNILEGTESAASTIPYLLGGRVKALGGIFGSTVGQIDDELEKSNYSPEGQYAIRVGKGLIEAGTEAYGVGKLLSKWGNNWVKDLAEFVLKDVAGEYSAEALDWLLSKATYKKDLTVPELMQQFETLTYQLPVNIGATVAVAKGAQTIRGAAGKKAQERNTKAALEQIAGQQAIEALKPPQSPGQVTPQQTARQPGDVGPSAATPVIQAVQETQARQTSANAVVEEMQAQAQARAELQRQEEITAAEGQKAQEVEAQKQQAFATAEAETAHAKATAEQQAQSVETQVAQAKAENERQIAKTKEDEKARKKYAKTQMEAEQKAAEVEAEKQKFMKDPQPKAPTAMQQALVGAGVVEAPKVEVRKPEAPKEPEVVAPEITINKKWDVFQESVGGVKRWLVSEGEKRGAGDTIHPTEESAIEYRDFKVKQETSLKEEAVKAEKIETEKQVKEQKHIASFTGFLDGSAMSAGKKRKTLEKLVNRKGRIISRKDLIEKLVKEGRVVGEYNGEPTLETSDGSFLGVSQLTKTGIDYAKHLIAQKPKAEAPKPPGIEVTEPPVEESTSEAPKLTEGRVKDFSAPKTAPSSEGRIRVPENHVRTSKPPKTSYSVELLSEELAVLPQTEKRSEVGKQKIAARDAITNATHNLSGSGFVYLSAKEEKVVLGLISDLEINGFPTKGVLMGVRTFMRNTTDHGGLHRRLPASIGNHSIVGLQSFNIRYVAVSPKDLMTRTYSAMVVAHEMMHSVDAGTHAEADAQKKYNSTVSPLFSAEVLPGKQLKFGSVLSELVAAWESNTLGLTHHFDYPFGDLETLSKTKSAGKVRPALLRKMQVEGFAQLAALYAVQDTQGRAALKEALPGAVSFMEELYDILGKTNYDTVEQRDAAVQKVFRRGESVDQFSEGVPVDDAAKAVENSDITQATEYDSAKVGEGGKPTKPGADGLLGEGTPFSIPKNFGVPPPGGKPPVDSAAAPSTPKPPKEVQKAIKGVDAEAPKAAGIMRTFLQRNFTSRGLLNEPTHGKRLQLDNDRNVAELDTEFYVVELEKAVTKAFGYRRYNAIPNEKLYKVNEYLAGDTEVSLPEGLAEEVDGLRATIIRLSGAMKVVMKDLMEVELTKVSDKQRANFDKYMETKGEEGSVPTSVEKYWNLYEAIDKNMGLYLTRSYQAFNDRAWMKKVLKDEKVVEAMKDYLQKQAAMSAPEFMQELRDEIKKENTGIKGLKALNAEARKRVEAMSPNILSEEELMGEIKGILQDAKDGANFLNVLTRGRMLGSKDTTIIRKKKDLAPEVRALLGEYRDPKVNFVNTFTKMTHFLANHEFLMAVRRRGLNSFLFENRIGEFYAKISEPKNEAMSPLAGLYTTVELRTGLEDANDILVAGDIARVMLKINAVVKYGKVAVSPATQIRNFTTAAIGTLLNGHFNWMHTAKSFRATRADLFTQEPKMKAYLRELVSLGVLHQSPRSEELKVAFDLAADVSAGVYTKDWKQPLRKFLRFIQHAYRTGDDFWKIVGYENQLAINLRQGMSLPEAKKKAAYRIQNGYMTYSLVPRAIKAIRKWWLIGTFVSFSSEVLRTYKNQYVFMYEDLKQGNKEDFARRLSGVVLVSSAAHAASYASMLLLGLTGDDDDAFRAGLPEYQKNSTLIYTGFDEEGYPTFLDTSYYDLYGYPKKVVTAVFNANNETFMGTLVDVSSEAFGPFLGVEILPGAMLEFLENKKKTGASVYNPQDSAWHRGVDIYNHFRKAAQPGIASNIERIADSFDNDRMSTSDEIFAFFGIRMGRAHMPYMIKNRAYEFKKDKKDAQRLLMREVKRRGTVSEDDLAEALSRTKDARKRVYSRMLKTISGAKRFKVKEEFLRTVLRTSGVSLRDINYLLSEGEVPPYRLSPVSALNLLKNVRAESPKEEKVNIQRKELLRRIDLVRKLSNE